MYKAKGEAWLEPPAKLQTHAGAFQAVFHHAAACSFGHAAADGVSFRQVFIVPHMLLVVVVVRNDGLEPFAFLARQTRI